MADVVSFDLDQFYMDWKQYVSDNSEAKHFGMFNDQSVAEFPYSCLTIIGRATNATDLVNTECTVDLTFQVDNYINSQRISSLYAMDDACWEFFQERGFRRMGDTSLSVVSNTNIKRLTSRYNIRNFNGKFLNELG